MRKYLLITTIGVMLLAGCGGNNRNDEGTSGFGERDDTLYEDIQRSNIPKDTVPMPAPFDTVADTTRRR